MFVDSHCHLNYFDGQDLINIIDRAVSGDVKILQTISTKIQEIHILLDIIRRFRNKVDIRASVGIHPCNVRDESFVLVDDLLQIIVKNSEINAIGETGLDYYHSIDHKILQNDLFRMHIFVAEKTNLPLVIHSRDAFSDTLFAIKDSYAKKLMHCFTYSVDECRSFLDCGCYISIAGIVTFKNATVLQDVARFVPLDRLLIETDSPYLAPEPMRGKKNEPFFVTYIASKISELKKIPVEDLAFSTTNNYHALFTRSC